MSRASRGHSRERDAKRLLHGQGWWVARAAGSLGDADLVALKAIQIEPEHVGLTFSEARLIEVKANVDGGPYMNFRTVSRNELEGAAEQAGATAELLYWPPREDPKFISHLLWPRPR